MTLNRSRMGQLLESFAGKKILIVGDIMVDEFIWGKVQRISPEAPVPVVEVMDETYRQISRRWVVCRFQSRFTAMMMLRDV